MRSVLPTSKSLTARQFAPTLCLMSSGSTAKRFMVGFGAGRSTVDCRLVGQGADGKELSNVRLRVRGNLAFSPYQGNNTQRRQAVNSFDQRLLEEIEKMK